MNNIEEQILSVLGVPSACFKLDRKSTDDNKTWNTACIVAELDNRIWNTAPLIAKLQSNRSTFDKMMD